MNPKETFKSPEERGKFVKNMIDEVKADMQAGVIKDWGTCIDGSGGYCIFEVPSESDVFVSIHRWIPQVDFDARQVLTVEQLIQVRKAPASLTGEQTP